MKKILYTNLLLSTLLLSCSDEFLEENAELIIEDSKLINEDQYWVHVFETNKTGDVKIESELFSGPSVEVYTMDNSNYNLWETQVANGQFSTATFKYFSELSIVPLASTDETDWVTLEKGKYAIIVENTDYGTVAPPFNLVDDSALVGLKVWAY